MTTPPDFGGLEIEEGVQEDLGLRQAAPAPGEPDDLAGLDAQESAALDDNEAHAPGALCARCGAEIEPGQDVRRRADGKWVHEVCP